MPITHPLFTRFIERLITQYKDEYIPIDKPIQAFSASLNEKTGMLTLDFKEKTLTGVFSAPYLLLDAYWRDIEGVLDFFEYSSTLPYISKDPMFLHHDYEENLNDYLAIINILLEAGLKKEAILCLTNLQAANHFGLLEEDEINEKIPLAILSQLTDEEKREIFTKVDTFQGRKKASSSVLLKNVIEPLSNATLIKKVLYAKEMQFPIIHSSNIVKTFNFCIQPIQDLIENKEPILLEILYPIIDIIISNLHRMRAYEEELVLLNLAIEKNINLPMQYLRRWEVHYYLNDTEKAGRDWKMAEDYYDRYQTARKPKKELVFWQGNLVNYRAARLLVLAEDLVELSEGKHPNGFKTKKLKITPTEQQVIKKRAQQTIAEAHKIIGNYNTEHIEADYNGFVYSRNCSVRNAKKPVDIPFLLDRIKRLQAGINDMYTKLVL